MISTMHWKIKIAFTDGVQLSWRCTFDPGCASELGAVTNALNI